MRSDVYVGARVDRSVSARAAQALGAMGLSVADAIRLLMLRIAEEGRLPFTVDPAEASISHDQIGEADALLAASERDFQTPNTA